MRMLQQCASAATRGEVGSRPAGLVRAIILGCRSARQRGAIDCQSRAIERLLHASTALQHAAGQSTLHDEVRIGLCWVLLNVMRVSLAWCDLMCECGGKLLVMSQAVLAWQCCSGSCLCCVSASVVQGGLCVSCRRLDRRLSSRGWLAGWLAGWDAGVE